MADEILLNDDEYVPAIVELDGEQFEVIDTIELDGNNYVALTPYTEEDVVEGDELEFIILEIVDNNDNETCTLKTVDDEDLYSRIGDKFLELFDSYETDEE